MGLIQKNKDFGLHHLDSYAIHEMEGKIPKFKIPENPNSPRSSYQIIHDELMLDGNSRQNLATFCQTWLEPEIHKLMDECIDKNMIDKDEYPQTAEIENRCVHILADLWNAPHSATTIGCSTTGSSEAAILGGLAMKWKWKAKRQEQGKSTDKPNIVTGPVQVCWHKFARYFEVEIREAPMDKDRYRMTPEAMLELVDENTIGVVPTLGLTFTCQYEDIQAISNALDDLQKRTGLDIPIHVDAASGGFIAPFVTPDLIWDFRLERVKSINASGHKFGLSPLGVGWIIWREEADLHPDLIFHVNYLGGNMPTLALNFSRPGGQIVAQYYNFLRHGREGYRRLQQTCLDNAAYIADKLEEMGCFDIIYNGKGGLPGVCWKLKSDRDYGFSLYDLSDRMRSRGWQIASYSLPPNAEEIVVQRVLIRYGFSRNMANMLLEDFKRCLEYFEKNPVHHTLSEVEAGGYTH